MPQSDKGEKKEKPNSLKAAIAAVLLLSVVAPVEVSAYGLINNTNRANPQTVPGVGGNGRTEIGTCRLQFEETRWPGQSSFPFAPTQAREIRINIGAGFQMFASSDQVARNRVFNKRITGQGVRVSDPATIESECGVTNVEIVRTFFNHSNPAGSWTRRFNSGQSMGMEIHFDEPRSRDRQRIVAQYISPEFTNGNPSGATQVSKINILRPFGPLAVASVTTLEVTTLDPFDFRVSFSTPVANFTLSDVVLTGPATATSISGSGRGPYLVTVTPTGNGVVSLNVPAGVATDSEGRLSRASLTPRTTVNAPLNQAPLISFTDDVDAGPVPSDQIVIEATDPNATDTLTISYDFVSDPAACVAPLSLGNTVSPTGTSPLTTAPIALSTANNGDYVCSAVNDGTETTYQVSANAINIDSNVPSVVSIAGPETFDDMSPIPLTITFSEPVDGFDSGTDVGLVNATPGTITPISPDGNGFATAWTVMVTPVDDTQDITIDVLAGAADDAANNPSTASSLSIQGLVKSEVFDRSIEFVEEVLTEDLLVTTRVLSQSASNISRRAADRLQVNRGQACVARVNELLQSAPVRFSSGSFFIDASNAALLDELALEISRCPDATFTIAGHTDSDASDAYNLTLSQNRVDAVKAALVQRGIANDRLQTRGFGESRPIATNATEEGQALNRRVEFILSNEDTAMDATCDSGGPLGGNLDGQSDGDNANLAGTFGSEGYNCVTGERTETWGEVSVTHNDDVGTLGLMTFGRSKETQTDNALSGRFVEGYVSRNSVDSATAEGTITGFGVHAGLYRAQALEGGLVLNYYGSAAVGRHSFDLEVGTDVDGHYTYAGVFAGAAIGGERAMGEMVLKPTVGIDLAYSKAIGSEISIPGSLDIEPAEYARGFVELGLERATETGILAIAPRVFCDTKEDDDADACGFGGKVSFESAADATGASWDVAFDYEAVDTLQNASLSVVRTQSVFGGMGVSKSGFGASAGGALQAEQTISFTW